MGTPQATAAVRLAKGHDVAILPGGDRGVGSSCCHRRGDSGAGAAGCGREVPSDLRPPRVVFKPVSADVGGNLEKMKAALERAPADTIHKALLAEKAAGKSKDKNSMAIAVLWYKRAMQFIFAIMKKVAAGQEANAAAKEAYEETLSAYHGFMVKKTFQMGLMGAPGTDTMLKALGSDPELTKKEMGAWVAAAEPILANIDAFLIKEGLDDKTAA